MECGSSIAGGCCSLRVVCCWVFVVCCSLFLACCLLLGLFVACCLLFVACCLLLNVSVVGVRHSTQTGHVVCPLLWSSVSTERSIVFSCSESSAKTERPPICFSLSWQSVRTERPAISFVWAAGLCLYKCGVRRHALIQIGVRRMSARRVSVFLHRIGIL